MRAIVIRAPGGPDVLELQERLLPEPGPGQVRVRIAATALNRADLLQRRGQYPAPPGVAADVPGLEFAGIVDACGPGSELWRVGERVMGLAGGGSYAEAVVVHERELTTVPDRLTLEEAAAVPEAFITAHDALFTLAGLATGERLLIHAVGSGVGTAALQLAAAVGATSYGTARSVDKLQRAATLGLPAEHAIDSSGRDWAGELLERTRGTGVDVVLELVGGHYVAGDLRVLAERGRIALVGLVAGRSVELDLSVVLRRRITIVGTVLRSRPLEQKIAATRAFARHVLPLLASGHVVPIIDRVLPMSEVAEAHRLAEANANFGKIVLRW
jgi:NADPH2:quinone reductase